MKKMKDRPPEGGWFPDLPLGGCALLLLVGRVCQQIAAHPLEPLVSLLGVGLPWL